MALLVLAYPKISQSYYDWIQAIRQEADKVYYDVVNPHFTIVFATDKLSLEELTAHVQKETKNYKSFDITLDSTKTIKDDFQDVYHAFLIPSQGDEAIATLHNVLYCGPLASELRQDLSYLPHVGIGTNESQQAARTITANIHAERKVINGRIDELTIVEYDGTHVTNLTTIPLAN